MGVAARLAAWERWLPGSTRTGVSSSVSGGTSPSRKVELFIDEAWVDITEFVYERDRIVITRGRSDEQAQLDRSTCRFTLNNRDGRFSPRNPLSPLYGKIGRNTPLRISVAQADVTRYRFYGEISSWPQAWDVAHADVWTQVEASGILRRLGQGETPVKSPMYRGMTSSATTNVIGYWPLEDGAGSSRMASALGGPPMTFTGTPTLANNSDFVSSAPLPTLGTGRFSVNVPIYTSTGSTQIRFLMAVPSGGMTTNTVPIRFTVAGSARTWQVYYQTGGLLGLESFDVDGANILDTGGVAFGVDGKRVRVSIELQPSGSNLAWGLVVLEEGASSGTVFAGTPAAYTVGRVTKIQLATSTATLDSCVLGHVSLQTAITSIFDLTGNLNAYLDENPSTRQERLSGEEGIPFIFVTKGQTGNAVTMGHQGIKTYLDLVRETVATDQGLFFEPRDQFGLGYRTRLSLYNQDTALALDYASGHISPPFAPIDDDQHVRNDITVTRDGASSARAVLESGALSILEPPAGVGRYDEQATISLGDDDQLDDQAGWRLHLGTVDEARYPTITLNLRTPVFADDQGMMSAALGLDIGDRVTIDDQPSWLPPDTISQIVQGYTETIGTFDHTLTLTCSPESPYQVGVIEHATLAALDTSGASLATAATAAATSLSVATPTGALWTTSSGLPVDVRLGGEVVTVTAISGSVSPQTFTVTRSVNGITKAHTAGTDVRLDHPMILSL